jgi:hypothetical protein
MTGQIVRLRLLLTCLVAAWLLVGCNASGGIPSPAPPIPTMPPIPVIPIRFGGDAVLTVTEALAARDGGTLGSTSVLLGGYWSRTSMGWSCPAPNHTLSDLEMWCVDTQFGITERFEQINEAVHQGNTTTWVRAKGPGVTPWIPSNLQQRVFRYRPSAPPVLVEQPPEPIVVRGHFHDARAAACAAEARAVCENRFVVEDVLLFADPGP